MQWARNDLDREEWAAVTWSAPFEQSWSYGAVAESLGARVHRFALRRGNEVVAAAQGIERRFLGLSCLWMPRGVHVPSPDIDLVSSPLGAEVSRRTLLMSPDAGIGLGHVPARAVVALGPDMRARLTKKWRNRLARAERSGLIVRTQAGPSKWLLSEEGLQRRRRRYRAMPPIWLNRLAEIDPGAVETRIAWHDGRRVAGITCLRAGGELRYQIGFTTEIGRAHGAHNLLLWRAMEAGFEAGAAHFDLGIADPYRQDGLTRFKLGTGATILPAVPIRAAFGPPRRRTPPAGAFQPGASVK